jgi:intein/homing endonuclease
MDALERAHAQLTKIRERTDLKLKPTPLLKETFTGFDGEEHELKIRYYQVQGILHLVKMNRFLLGDDTGTGKCVVGETLVKTNNGLVPIKDMNPGLTEPDTAAPVSGVKVEIDGALLPVRHFYYGGEKPTVKLRTRHGYELEGSLIHPVMVRREGRDEWVQLKDLQEGDLLAVERKPLLTGQREEPALPAPGPGAPNERQYSCPTRMSPELARFLGYLVAESWFRRHDFYELQSDAEGHVLCSTQIIRFLEGLGVTKGLAQDKRVPWAVLHATPASIKEFLRGYVDAESSVDHQGIEVSSASETLLRQVQIMLLGFGVVSSRQTKMIEGRDHTYWRLTILGEDARRFMQEIGLVTQRKVDAIAPLREKSANPNHDVVPTAQGPVEDLRQEIYAKAGRHGYKGEGITKRWGVAFYNTLQHIRTGRRNPTYQYLERMLRIAAEVEISSQNPAYRNLNEIVERRWFYDAVEQLEDGWAEVFDLEVDDPRHAFVANGIISHNTLMSIASLCFVWARDPDTKVVILTNKSVVGQWALEFEKFCTAGEINVITCVGNPAKREKIYKEFEASTGPTVLIMGYATSRRDIKHIQEWKDYVFITDEATAFKNPSTQIYQVVRHMSSKASRFWALTATLIKNNLIEGFGIYSVLVPGLFPKSKNAFMNQYCMTRLQPIPGSRRQIPVIIGYRPEHIQLFKEKIDPYFLARAKMDVATELPVLQIREHKVGLTRAQRLKYEEALTGLMEIDNTGEEKETTKLTQLIYCQQIVDHPSLIECEGDSEKLDELFEMITEGDLAEDKVIVFSRFRKMIDLLEETAKSKRYKLPTVRITGTEDENQRKAAMQKFQDPNSDVRVCWITTAAAEGINLQAAKAIIFYDSPWSAGDYLQILGRMIRIGSVHDRCYAIHLVASGSIDVRVMGVLRKKMKLIEAVMGKRLKGEDGMGGVISSENDISDLFAALQADARKRA